MADHRTPGNDRHRPADTASLSDRLSHEDTSRLNDRLRPDDRPGLGDRLRPDDSAPVYVISVAAQIAGLHPQTLRQYDRLGLVSPDRTGGRNRLYSLHDIERLREVSRLSADGVNLAGIQRILTLTSEVDTLRAQLGTLLAEVQRLRPSLGMRSSDEPSTALVVWRPRPADRDRTR
jgi:MerR family transcriptional regulator/heat shock protein HspR